VLDELKYISSKKDRMDRELPEIAAHQPRTNARYWTTTTSTTTATAAAAAVSAI
jgi:hypothetical protein